VQRTQGYAYFLQEWGAHSRDIAQKLGRAVHSLAPTRAKLIHKGMVWSPSHGDTDFSVPLFDEFMRRIIPEFDPE